MTDMQNETRAIVKTFYKAFNAGDASRARVSETWVTHPAPQGTPRGRDGLKAMIEQTRAAFPDFSVESEDLLVDGDRVVSRNRVQATHAGEFQGLPATGTLVSFMTIDEHRVEDGRIVESWHIEDYLSVIQQVGGQIRQAS